MPLTHQGPNTRGVRLVVSEISVRLASIHGKICVHSAKAELLFAKPLTADNQFSIFLGIGAGYYNYEYRMESENNDNSGEDKIDITGVAQYFTFGSEVKVADRTSAFLQFKKPGFSFIKAKTTGDYSAMEEDAKPLDGFWDVGIAVGVRWSI